MFSHQAPAAPCRLFACSWAGHGHLPQLAVQGGCWQYEVGAGSTRWSWWWRWWWWSPPQPPQPQLQSSNNWSGCKHAVQLQVQCEAQGFSTRYPSGAQRQRCAMPPSLPVPAAPLHRPDLPGPLRCPSLWRWRALWRPGWTSSTVSALRFGGFGVRGWVSKHHLNTPQPLQQRVHRGALHVYSSAVGVGVQSSSESTLRPGTACVEPQ